ncbi:acyltransferase family protein [Novosphingobium sp. FGD1]|uniref:Acyltransferase family protein n=1 Tax=Novosphingobium silvae TaxID=2692619 RepID=A0A7X4GES4_9SPHN|nr:acyltransferase [Novosphingobium silvae]MYL96437.1 acyltransferase family protein [Novosphingobium silvae]
MFNLAIACWKRARGCGMPRRLERGGAVKDGVADTKNDQAGLPLAATLQRHRFVFLDALRGLAAVMVVFYHRRELLPNGLAEHGYLAVDFFFMLSGFVIAYAYEDKLRTGMSRTSFIVRRLQRLMPLVILGACLGLFVEVLKALTKHSTDRLIDAVIAFPFAALSLPNLPNSSSEIFLLNPPTWSLFFELIANVLYALFIKRLSNTVVISVALASGAALFVISTNFDSVEVGQNFDNVQYGIFQVLFPFSTGILLFRYRLQSTNTVSGFVAAVLAVVLFAVLFTPVLPAGSNYLYDFALVAMLFPLTIYIGARVAISSGWFALFIEAAGMLSYAVYITHVPLLDALDYPLAWLSALSPIKMVVYVGVVIIAAYGATAFYDARIQAYFKRKNTPRRAW